MVIIHQIPNPIQKIANKFTIMFGKKLSLLMRNNIGPQNNIRQRSRVTSNAKLAISSLFLHHQIQIHRHHHHTMSILPHKYHLRHYVASE